MNNLYEALVLMVELVEEGPFFHEDEHLQPDDPLQKARAAIANAKTSAPSERIASAIDSLKHLEKYGKNCDVRFIAQGARKELEAII